MPRVGDLKSKWIESISNHQNISKSMQSFMVCERHFNITDFCTRRGKKALTNEAVPSIFIDEELTTFNNQVVHPTRRNYCKIKYCEYEVGTTDKAVLFFRQVLSYFTTIGLTKRTNNERVLRTQSMFSHHIASYQII